MNHQAILKCIFGFVFFIMWTSFSYANSPEEGQKNVKNASDLVENQLKELDFQEIQQYWDEIRDEYGGFFPESEKGSFVDYVKNIQNFSLKEWANGIVKFVFHELIFNGKLLGSLIILTIFSMFLQSLQNSFETTSVSKIAYAIVFIVLLIIALNSFHIAMNYAKNAIENMIHFTLAFIPLLLALMASSGSIVSAGFFHPVILFLTNISGIFVQNIVLPLLFLSTLLSVVSSLTEHYKATQLAQLLRNWSIGLLGIFMTVFLGVISVQGTVTAVADGVALKSAKFLTGNLIPVVGRMFTDALDTVISASMLLKNTIGMAGVGILLILVLFPTVKILMIAFIFKFSAAILQPLGGGPIIVCLDVIAKSVIYIFAALGIVSIMFFLSLTVIIVAGNLTMMVR